MTHAEFNQFEIELLDEVHKTIKEKGKKYAQNPNDRFSNFKRMAERMGVEPVQAAWFMLIKHLDSLETYTLRTQYKFMDGMEPLRMNFVDTIAYLSLIAGMIHEEMQLQAVSEGGEGGEIPFNKCAVCGTSYETLELLQTHVAQDHLPANRSIFADIPITTFTFWCQVCDSGFPTFDILTKHVREKHTEIK